MVFQVYYVVVYDNRGCNSIPILITFVLHGVILTKIYGFIFIYSQFSLSLEQQNLNKHQTEKNYYEEKVLLSLRMVYETTQLLAL